MKMGMRMIGMRTITQHTMKSQLKKTCILFLPRIYLGMNVWMAVLKILIVNGVSVSVTLITPRVGVSAAAQEHHPQAHQEQI